MRLDRVYVVVKPSASSRLEDTLIETDLAGLRNLLLGDTTPDSLIGVFTGYWESLGVARDALRQTAAG